MCHNNWHLINKWPAKVALLVNANDGPGRMSPEKNVRKIKREKAYLNIPENLRAYEF